jgi:hypothetical protein
MKKFLTISLLLTAVITATAQVSLQPVVPAVGMIQKTQLWNVLIANSSSVQYNCRLELVLKDRSSNLEVFTATTSLFALGAGAKQFNINSLGPIQYNYLSPGFDAKQTGLLPVGNYTACYSLTGTGEKAVNLADECIQFDIEPLSPPMLISPADSSILETAPAQFSWIPPAPQGMFSRLNYEIIITPVNEGQKASEAIEENVPFYSQGNLTANFLSYTAAYQSFEKDKWYAWQIVARDDKSYAAKAETWVFKVNNPTNKIAANNGAFISLDHVSGAGVYNLSGRKLNIKYYSYDKSYESTVRILTTGRKLIQQTKQRITYGDNYFSLNVPGRLTSGTTYLLELVGLDGKIHSAVIRIIQ